MVISINKCDISQTLFDFICQNTTNGHAYFTLYEKSDYWLNSRGVVPFILKDGVIYWKVSIKEVTIYDLIKTFRLNNEIEIEIQETQFWSGNDKDFKKMTVYYLNYWKSLVSRWYPEGRLRQKSKIKKFILQAGVDPISVMEAIWTQDWYSIEEFTRLFNVNKKFAKSILHASGYQKKDCHKDYHLIPERKQEILTCLDKEDEAYNQFGADITTANRLKNKISNFLVIVGGAIVNIGKKQGFMSNELSNWKEPAYGERKEHGEKILIATLTIGMAVFVIMIMTMFLWQFSTKPNKFADTLYSFWGSIVGAMIAGLVTICTTYLIIRRSYKIDFHRERMDVLPFFEIKMIKNHFSMYEKVPKDIHELQKQHICYINDLTKDSILIEITNIGREIAFNVLLSGPWPEYEDYSLRDMSANTKKYIIFASREEINFKITYCDIYGNCYYQKFYTEKEYGDDAYLGISSEPPELVLRTERIRYNQ